MVSGLLLAQPKTLIEHCIVSAPFSLPRLGRVDVTPFMDPYVLALTLYLSREPLIYSNSVIPAKAGIQWNQRPGPRPSPGRRINQCFPSKF